MVHCTIPVAIASHFDLQPAGRSRLKDVCNLQARSGKFLGRFDVWGSGGEAQRGCGGILAFSRCFALGPFACARR